VVNLHFIKEIIRSGALISKKSMLHFFIIFIAIPQTTFKKNNYNSFKQKDIYTKKIGHHFVSYFFVSGNLFST
jgi:hypothetical protein